jgi:rubredoxin/hemerythrin-like domain-containing protein
MKEHRLIEHMNKMIEIETNRINSTKKVDIDFIDVVIDFLRTYADRCHHGKEEDILFRELSKKNLSDIHRKMMNELIEEHAFARKTVKDLEIAKDNYASSNIESLKDVLKLLGVLVEFYSLHIQKEDKQFFYPSMEYLNKQEQESMVQEFWEFDRKMIHEKYQMIVDNIEKTYLEHLAKWKCIVCGYIYDPEKGDPENGIPPGLPFEELPEKWVCPVCNARKTEFEKITELE